MSIKKTQNEPLEFLLYEFNDSEYCCKMYEKENISLFNVSKKLEYLFDSAEKITCSRTKLISSSFF